MAARPFDPALAEQHHLLALAGDVPAEELDVLATSRFSAAGWEVPAEPAARRGRSKAGPIAVLRLSRLSSLRGPYPIDRAAAAALGLPGPTGQVWLLHAPVERGEAPWPGAADRDGLGRAFPDGLPIRDEERVVTWLVAAARRLAGAVRVTGVGGGPATVLVPDPAAAVDLTVWSDIWLDPEAALSVVRQAVPRARLDLGTPWDGPPAGTGVRPVPGAEDLDARERAALHQAADDRDLEALTQQEVRSAYGMLADLDLDGVLAVEVGGETRLPQALAGVPWASGGAVTYRVSWAPDELADLGMERPPIEHRIARGRAAPLVNAVARALHAAVAGEITDMMGFIVDPADL
ncbi:hypothetical protein [Actinotalea sp.]|uniref:hypothetical protein n=1 Tax=Actinotalea sp. TaxID=1872145 RepID=UPI003568E8FD